MAKEKNFSKLFFSSWSCCGFVLKITSTTQSKSVSEISLNLVYVNKGMVFWYTERNIYNIRAFFNQNKWIKTFASIHFHQIIINFINKFINSFINKFINSFIYSYFINKFINSYFINDFATTSNIYYEI